AMLLLLTPSKYYAPGARHQGCLFVALAAMVTDKVPLKWQLPVSVLEWALIMTHMTLSDVLTHGSLQRPVHTALIVAACVVALPAVVMYGPERSTRQLRRRASAAAAAAAATAASSTCAVLSPPLLPTKWALRKQAWSGLGCPSSPFTAASSSDQAASPSPSSSLLPTSPDVLPDAAPVSPRPEPHASAQQQGESLHTAALPQHPQQQEQSLRLSDRALQQPQEHLLQKQQAPGRT
ncbi:hypothetical protein Agub_g13754, partial [Astrephomene gubernaculifera]